MRAPYIIEAADVWKRYGLPLRSYLRRRYDRLRGDGVEDRERYGPWVLRDISFAIPPGESLGIVGKNGAGKSTLLRLIAGVSPVTHGKMRVSGRLFPMIELAAGMHNELTGRENIKLLGAIMGFNARQMEAKMPVIEDFSELGDWLDKPIWQYSSGMTARLGFSVAINVRAEILLIDEVLSVGDVNFQKKCLKRMDELINSGVTVVFVTHNPYAVERLCDRVIYLEDGRIVAAGSPSDILNSYFKQTMDRSTEISSKSPLEADQREGTGTFRVVGITMHDIQTGAEITGFGTSDSVDLRIALRVKEAVPIFRFSLRIVDPAGTVVSYVNVPSEKRRCFALRRDSVLQCRISNINLLPGQYWVDVVAQELEGRIIDSVTYAYRFTVHGSSEVMEQMEQRGIVFLPSQWQMLDEPQDTGS